VEWHSDTNEQEKNLMLFIKAKETLISLAAVFRSVTQVFFLGRTLRDAHGRRVWLDLRHDLAWNLRLSGYLKVSLLDQSESLVCCLFHLLTALILENFISLSQSERRSSVLTFINVIIKTSS